MILRPTGTILKFGSGWFWFSLPPVAGRLGDAPGSGGGDTGGRGAWRFPPPRWFGFVRSSVAATDAILASKSVEDAAETGGRGGCFFDLAAAEEDEEEDKVVAVVVMDWLSEKKSSVEDSLRSA